jgi:hypothetical protein
MFVHIHDRFNDTISGFIALAIAQFLKQSDDFKRKLYDLLHGDATKTREAADELLKLIAATSEEDRRAFSARHFPRIAADMSYEYDASWDPDRIPRKLAEAFFHSLKRDPDGTLSLRYDYDCLSPNYVP